jgi:aminoglycoside 6'-N-acetyltransferase
VIVAAGGEPVRPVSFRPLRRADAEQLRDWFNEPHVFAWWGVHATPDGLGGTGLDAATRDAVLTEYGAVMDGRDSAHGFVILVDDQPVGYIEWYRLAEEPEYAAAIGESDGAGMDLLIGDPGAVGRGLGPQAIDRFVTDVVVPSGISRVFAGPDVRNRRSVRAFLKAGFLAVREVQVPGEPAPELLLTRAEGDPGK